MNDMDCPPQFHRIWFGPQPIPPQYETYWLGWQRQFPQARFTTWRDADIPRLTRARPKIAEAASWSGKADVARYEILHDHGGVYLDSDVMPYQWFDAGAFGDELVVCNEDASTEYCSTSFFAAPVGHPVFLDVLRAIASTDLSSDTPNVTTGPWAFGKAVKMHRAKRLKTATFYPYHYDESRSAMLGRDLSATWGIHVWGGSWLAPEQHLALARRKLQQGDLPEALKAPGPDDGTVRHAARLVRQTREQVLNAVSLPVFDRKLRSVDLPKFEFLKVLFQLLERNPDRMVWQVGAADGILVDPLRPAMVNFDPPALLLEPNPYLYERLARNYANNRRARCVQAAFGPRSGTMVLQAMVPARVQAAGLEDWALGLSSAYTDRNALGGIQTDPVQAARLRACVVPTTVPMLDMPRLLDLADGRPPEVLVVDAEGMDRVVIDGVLDTGVRPALIHFEVQCLPRDDAQGLLARLNPDYVVLPFGNDMTAYRRDVFWGYVRMLYLEQGMATVHAGAIHQLFGR